MRWLITRRGKGKGWVGCDIDTVLNKGEVAISKMAIWWQYYSTDWNRFREDAINSWEEFICEVSTTFFRWLQRRCDSGKIQNGRQ